MGITLEKYFGLVPVVVCQADVSTSGGGTLDSVLQTDCVLYMVSNLD